MIRFPAVVWLLAAACESSAGPPLLAAEYHPEAFDLVSLGWTHPTGEATGGYSIEMRAVPQPFGEIATNSPQHLSYVIRLDPETPELIDFEFRVRALPESEGSRTSNIVAVRRGLRAPVLRCVSNAANCVPSNGAFQLEWTLQSRVADEILLERAVVPVNGPAGAWTRLPVSYPATTYSDTDLSSWSHGNSFQYRLTAAKGNDRSLPALLFTWFAPP